jgi:son of sevenless-like protein
MAAVAAPMYSSHHHAFTPSSSRNTTTVINSSQQQSHLDEDLDDQFTTLFCRALYDYEAQDASALSFRQNDIIEVLTQQPSGWWDGLLGDERGWFPSNYVTVISDEEAELAFSGSELSMPERQTNNLHADNNSVLDMSHAMMRGTQAENEHWLDTEIGGLGGGMDELANTTLNRPLESSDFWMPDVTSDGQVSLLLDLRILPCLFFSDILCEYKNWPACSRATRRRHGHLRQ